MSQFHLSSQAGILGEKLAKKYLEERGQKVLAENYYFSTGVRRGEIDLVTLFQEKIRFIEVKIRIQKSGNVHQELPSAAVTRKKLQNMEKTAQRYLQESGYFEKEIHFDVVAILYNPTEKTAKIQYFQDVFF